MSFLSDVDDDLALVERCLHGDNEAFRPLVERYQRVLYTVAVRILGDAEEANDAAQTAFVRAYEKLTTFDGRHKFFSWLYRILVNECLNVRRARHAQAPLDARLAASEDPLDAARCAETRARVHAALAQLPRAQREVIVLRHFAELSYREIAETLGVEEKTVKSRLYDARQRLGELLLGWDGQP